MTNDNFTKMPIFNNSLFNRSKDDIRCIDANLLGIYNLPPIIDAISRATYADFCNNSRINSLHEINLKLGIELSLLTYIRIGQALTFFNSKLKANRITSGHAASLLFFVKNPAKGSKKYRKILTEGGKKGQKIEELPAVVGFYNHVKCFYPQQS